MPLTHRPSDVGRAARGPSIRERFDQQSRAVDQQVFLLLSTRILHRSDDDDMANLLCVPWWALDEPLCALGRILDGTSEPIG